ncbi:MAG: protein TolR [Nevskia sp.]|nr:protein TolR [Nevskia sp.]
MPAVHVRNKRRLNAEINVVPYIDVMLVLLVIFMVTAPLLTQGIDVQLPQTNSEAMPQEEEPVTFSVDRRGRFFLDIGQNTSDPLSDADVVNRVAAVLRNKPQTMILVRADQGVDYGQVVKGMSLLQAAGASKIGFVTEPAAAPAPARKPG